MSFARSLREAPSARRERIKRSKETVGSPVSILATRDWLERTTFASSVWVSFRRRRRCLSPSASRSRISTYASSSGDRSRNSRVVPTFQPLASSRFFFCSRIVVLPESSPARLDHRPRGCRRLLDEDLADHNRVWVHPVHDSPRDGRIHDAELVTTGSDNRHGPGLRHGETMSLLQTSEQESSLQARLPRERRGLHLAVEPDERFVAEAHPETMYVGSDIRSSCRPAP